MEVTRRKDIVDEKLECVFLRRTADDKLDHRLEHETTVSKKRRLMIEK